jgi:apolipoprotein N-acyltransferase
MKNWLKNQQSGLIACLLGVMATFAFAPYEIYPLAILAPAGLFGLIYRANPIQASALGFKFGLGYFGAGVYWLFISIHTFGDVPAIGAGALTAALVAILSIYPALVCYVSNKYFPINQTERMNYAFPALWVFSEWFRGVLFTGFPWLFIGYSQTNSPLSGFAPIFGVYGVSTAALLCSVLMTYAAINYRAKQFQSMYKHIFAFLLIWIAGAALSLIPWTHHASKSVAVSMVQGNIPQSLKWDPDNIKLSFDRYEEMTTPLLKKDSIIIWPEAAIPMPLQYAEDFIQMMDQKARDAGAHILLGIPMQDEDKDGYYNALISVGNDKHLYAKRLLVPFGEYIPLQKYTANLFKIINIPMPNTVPGKKPLAAMEIGGIKFLPAICYEVTFPDLMRSNDPEIGVLLTVTNDAWYGNSNAQAQHLQIAAMRASEMRRPALFASNDGITAVINPDGRIVAAAPQHETTVLNATVQPTLGMTPWMRNGADPLLVMLIAMLIISRRSSRKTVDDSSKTAASATA